MHLRVAMVLAGSAALLLIAPVIASACECVTPIHAGNMRAAKHAVVVRVISTGLPPVMSPTFGISNVAVIDRLRGAENLAVTVFVGLVLSAEN